MFVDMIKQKESNIKHIKVNWEARCVTATGREKRENDDNNSFNKIINGKPVIQRSISQVLCLRNIS